MLFTRLWMGALLIALAVGLLWLDSLLGPWYPILLFTTLLGALLGCHELLTLLPQPKPMLAPCLLGVGMTILANWPAHIWHLGEAWTWVSAAVAASLILFFLIEAATYREPGGSVRRLSLGFWVIGYLGFLSCFFVQLRWLPHGTSALALAIFVPKCGDIGAYFTGRAIGRHRMTPVLSPKKTWEGAAGGMMASIVAALTINAIDGNLFSWPVAAACGVVVGGVAIIGDLMESLIKRDCNTKDASQVVPGFGGVLDVVDSILFGAPLTYGWLALAFRE